MTTFTPQLATTNTDGTEKNSPKPINSGDVTTSGQPSTAPTAAGSLKNTTLAKMNDSLAHVCDITGNIKYAIAWTSLKISEAIAAIRTFLEGLWGSASSSPFGDQVRAAIKYIKAKITIAKKYIKKAQDADAAVKQFISDVQALIAYIATLPAKLAAILKQCLSDAVASIKDAVTNAAAIVKTQATSTASSEVADQQATLSKNESIIEVPPIITPMSRP